MSSPNQVDPIILDAFKSESTQLLDELEELIAKLEQSGKIFPTKALMDFSQKIDRIMGAAKTMSMAVDQDSSFAKGLTAIGKLTATCKAMGYKAAEKNNPALIPLFAAFWSDVLEVVNSILENLESDEEVSRICKSFPEVLHKRLEWLAKKLENK